MAKYCDSARSTAAIVFSVERRLARFGHGQHHLLAHGVATGDEEGQAGKEDQKALQSRRQAAEKGGDPTHRVAQAGTGGSAGVAVPQFAEQAIQALRQRLAHVGHGPGHVRGPRHQAGEGLRQTRDQQQAEGDCADHHQGVGDDGGETKLVEALRDPRQDRADKNRGDDRRNHVARRFQNREYGEREQPDGGVIAKAVHMARVDVGPVQRIDFVHCSPRFSLGRRMV